MSKIKTKKVILFIVEGITDKTSLNLILSRIINSEKVKFKITDGDICYRGGVNQQNAINEVYSTIKSALKKDKLKKSDISEVVHLIDTDGAFIPEDKVIENQKAGTIYETDCIQTSHVQATQQRFKNKSEVVYKLCSRKEISDIPYHIYYFSRHLEHVLHNKPEDLSREEKNRLSEEFEDRFADAPSEFIKFIKSIDFAVTGTYSQTWRHIREGTNSLKRKCNFGIYFP